MSLKSCVKHSIFHSARYLPIFKLGKHKLRIVTYHNVGHIHLSADAFNQHLLFYKQHFEPFFAHEIPQLLENNCKTDSGKPPIVLTFDDGMKNNATTAAPLLQKHNIKATFYLISRHLENQRMIWNHELFCQLYIMTPKDRAKISPLLTANEHANMSSGLREQIQSFINDVKRWPQEEKDRLIESLPPLGHYDSLPNELKGAYQIMSLDDARALPSCIDVGSHTLSHVILDKAPLASAVYEIAQSKVELESLLQRPIETFCYPNGFYTERTAQAVAQHYRVGLTTDEGFVRPGAPLNILNRISSRSALIDLCARLYMPRKAPL